MIARVRSLSNTGALRPRPLLILAAVASLIASIVALSAGMDGAMWIVAIPVAFTILALVSDGRRGAAGVLAATMILLLAFMVISAASVGLLYLPTAILMLLALRRAIKLRH